MPAEVYLDGAWRQIREIYLDGAWRPPTEIYLDGAWRGTAAGPANPPHSLTARDSSECVNGQANYWITLEWSNGDNTADVRVYKDGGYITQLAAGTVTHRVSVAAAGTYSGYTVRHVKNGIESGNSNSASATVYSLNCSRAPFNFSVTNTSLCTEYRAKLSWSNYNSTWQTQVYRNDVLITTVAAGVTEYNDNGLSGATHSWYVQHVNGVETYEKSNTITLTLQYNCDPPSAAPGTPTLQNNSTCVDLANGTASYEVFVSWTNGDSTATTLIYRNNVLQAEVAATVSGWTDTGISGPGDYTYHLVHRKNGQDSAASGSSTITIFNPCG